MHSWHFAMEYMPCVGSMNEFGGGEQAIRQFSKTSKSNIMALNSWGFVGVSDILVKEQLVLFIYNKLGVLEMIVFSARNIFPFWSMFYNQPLETKYPTKLRLFPHASHQVPCCIITIPVPLFMIFPH